MMTTTMAFLALAYASGVVSGILLLLGLVRAVGHWGLRDGM